MADCSGRLADVSVLAVLPVGHPGRVADLDQVRGQAVVRGFARRLDRLEVAVDAVRLCQRGQRARARHAAGEAGRRGPAGAVVVVLTVGSW